MARILLADDDGSARDLVRRALESDGHVVVAVDDGLDAEAQVRSTVFDVVVSDVQMPGIDGIELARRILASQPLSRIILMSGLPDALDRARGLGAPEVRTISKPFTIDRIRAEVRSILAG